MLDAGGRTIAVLGSGLDHVYPPENRALAKQIAESGRGAVMSEYELGTKPQAKNFPPRNRIISGLSLGTIVVEGDMTSGAMITAKFALEQNREVFAVPGYVTSPASSGPNWLIQQGAKLITNVQDVLDELKLGEPAEKAAVQMALPTSPEEAELMPFLTREPQHVDDIARTADLPSAYVSSTLMMLELKGLVQHVGGMKIRQVLGPPLLSPPPPSPSFPPPLPPSPPFSLSFVPAGPPPRPQKRRHVALRWFSI